MPERPLLLFPKPASASKNNLPSGFSKPFIPDVKHQGQRLHPKYKALEDAFQKRAVEIRTTTAGIDPEQVLVLETYGAVEGFMNAAQKIPGLEWLGELDVEAMEIDEDYFDGEKPPEEISGRLYMLMSNSQALSEMLSLWKKYESTPDMKFGHGKTKFRDIFLRLKTLRRWDIQDRLIKTGILERWKETLSVTPDQPLRCEIEIWFSQSEGKRKSRHDVIIRQIQELDGKILASSIRPEIAYHGVLVELPVSAVQHIIDNHSEKSTIKLIKCDNIMYFRPSGQMVVSADIQKAEGAAPSISDRPLPQGDPVIAILDGLPLKNHQLLADRLIIDDPDNIAQYYQASEHIHGSAMASLIVHGDLGCDSQTLNRPVYVSPIMRPLQTDRRPTTYEHVHNDNLFVDILHRAVRRIFEKTETGDPSAPSVRVINLSICDSDRLFDNSISPAAKMLDWLSDKYNVLFIISAGNRSDPVELGTSRRTFDSMPAIEKEKTVVTALFSEMRNRRLLSPAESINGLTVNALQQDATGFNASGFIFNPYTSLLPSPISPFGRGYKKSIKPDCIYSGGIVPFTEDVKRAKPNNYVIRIPQATVRSQPPGNTAAVPSQQIGNNGTAYSSGTSNAAALVSHASGFCYEVLRQIFYEQESEIDSRPYEAPLLKAMVVHGCSWGDCGTRLEEHIRTGHDADSRKKQICRWIEYGDPHFERVMECTERRATLLGYGHLSDGNAHIFTLPLPPSLGSQAVLKHMIVTLAWFSPIYPSTQKYRAAHLWFDVPQFKRIGIRRDACSGKTGWRSVRNGTLQHEIYTGDQAEPFVDNDGITIKVNCRADAGKILKPVNYGLAVTLGVGEGVNIAIYDEIRASIATAIQIRQTMDQDQSE